MTVGALTVLALWVGARLPLFGSAVSGMVLGLVLRNVFHIGGQFTQITGFCTKRLLKTAIVLLGSTFTLQQAALLGQKYLIVIVTTIAITLAAAYLAGRSCGVPRSLAGLIGAGTAICGATAILTVSPVVQARDEEVTYALSTVFLFNLVAMLLYPLVGHFVSMKEAAFGAWAGSAIHDTSSVL
ncbi:MAG: putative sulfate exporter family transporter, partial [Bacillota bacterium]